MAFTVNKKAFCVLEFAKTELIVTVQWRFRIMYHTELPTDKTIREWYMNSSRVAACALRNEQAVRAHRPCIKWGEGEGATLLSSEGELEILEITALKHASVLSRCLISCRST